MLPKGTSHYRRTDLLIVAAWWGLVAGLGEGLCSFYSHPWIWRDLISAAVICNPPLFASVALILVLSPSLLVTRELLVRANLGFGFLAMYDVCDALVPRLFTLLPFLCALISACIAALIFYLRGEGVMRFQRRSMLLLGMIAAACVIVFPIKQRWVEDRELAQLSAPATGARNGVVVVIDTLRADHLSAYGYSRPTSPNLKGIAQQGVQFDNAISSSSWTLPSHASMLTALYPHEHHVDHDTSNLGPGYTTLGDALRARGYRTAAFSGNAGTFGRDRGFGRGFIHFEDDFQSWGSKFGRTFYGGKIESRLCELHLMQDLLGRPSAAEINQRALRWIDSNRRPFFVFLNYYDVHDPYVPPDSYLHEYTQVKHPGGWYTQHWEWFERLTPQQRQAAMDAYDGAINYVDAEIAELMRELRKRGLTDNTLVIITSDHGEGFDEHGLMNHGNSLYRELIHVPLIIWEPGQVPAGKRVPEPVSLTALPSTVVDLLGAIPEPRFAVPSLKGYWNESKRRDLAHAAISELAQLKWFPSFPNYYGPMQSITTPEWHYITGGNSGEQLFHCCDETRESQNLAATDDGRKLCNQLREALQLALQVNQEIPAHQAGFAASHFADATRKPTNIKRRGLI
jgi:arylsulfatase A-like enzyme